MGEAAPVHNNVLLQKETEAPLQMQESAAYAESSTQTQEIMDQIMDYMKVQLKPEMDQLDMAARTAPVAQISQPCPTGILFSKRMSMIFYSTIFIRQNP